jgi:uncharacterized protein (TIGR00369 family)
MMDIALSPYARTMGLTIERDENGVLILIMPFDASKRGRPGFVHGGAIAGLLEVIAYAALSDALPDGDKPVLKPVNVTVSYMRGAAEATTYARATIERLGRRIANVEAIAWQDDPAKPVAVAQINVMLDHSRRDYITHKDFG